MAEKKKVIGFACSCALFVAALLALATSALGVSFAWAETDDEADDDSTSLVKITTDDPCTLTNAKGEKLHYAGSLGNGRIDTEMECFLKLYPMGLMEGACWLSVDRSDCFSIEFDDGKAHCLHFEALDFDVKAQACSGVTVSAALDGAVSAQVCKAQGSWRFYNFDESYGVILSGQAAAPANITTSASRELFVARGVPEGEVSVDGVDTVDGTNRYYALGGEIRAMQKKWETEGPDPDEEGYTLVDEHRTDTRIEGALPIKCGSAKSLRAGDARVTSELGGSAMWLNWDEVAGAKSYRVYEKRGKKWKPVALREGAGSSYALVRGAGAGAHRYRVRAFSDKAGKKPLGKAGFALSAVPSTDAACANADAVSLSKAKLSGRAGQAKRLKAAVSCAPGKRVLSKSVRWRTSDPKVAKVDKRGRVKLLKPGSCQVWAVAHDGVASAKVDVVVKKGKAKKAAPAKRAKALGLMAAGF